MSEASTSLYKKNGGFNYERKSWNEYPGFGKKWCKNHAKSFGKPVRPICSNCGVEILWGEAYDFDGSAYCHKRCPKAPGA